MAEVYQETEGLSTRPAPGGEERRVLREMLIGQKAERALAFQTIVVRHFGPAAGIFCRQLLFWDDKKKMDSNNWVYKSMKEWDEETGLKRRGQEKARKVLIGKGVMEEKKDKGPDGRQRLFFRLDLGALMELVGDDLPTAQPSTQAQDCTVLPDKGHDQYYRTETMPGNSGQAIQKTTQETTQKIPLTGGASAPHQGIEVLGEGSGAPPSITSTLGTTSEGDSVW